MKTLLLFLISLLLGQSCLAQQVILQGQVSILNSKHRSGQVEYVPNAWVSVDSGASVVTDEKGRFTVNVVGKSGGNATVLTVQKDGYAVVNQQDLQQVVLGRKGPLRVFLAAPEELAQVQAELYGISLAAMTERHRALVVLLRQGGEVADSTVFALQSELNREFEHRWAAEDYLREQLEALKKRLPEVVERLARVNLDFASQRYLEAWQAFLKGDVEAVFSVLAEEELDGDSQKATAQLAQNRIEGEAYLQAKLSLHENASQLIQAYQLKAEAHNLLFQFKQAALVFEKGLELLIKVKGEEEDLELAKAYGDLGEFRFQNGNYGLAEESVLKEIEIKTRLFPQGNQQINSSRGHLAEIYRLQSKLKLALEVKLQSPPQEGDSQEVISRLAQYFNDLAPIYLDLGEGKKALEAESKAIAYLEELDSVPPIRFAKYMNNLACTQRELGLYNEAVTTLKEAIQDIKADTAQFPLQTAELWGNLSILHHELKNNKDALLWSQKSVGILQNYLEPDHPKLGMAYHLLSLNHRRLGNYNEAISYTNLSIQILERTLGKTHFRYGSALNDLAIIYKSQGKPEKALETALECLAIREQNFAPLHPSLAISHNNLGRIYIALGRFEVALLHLTQAYEIRQASLEPEHPKLILSLTSLATVYRELGRIEKAQRKANEALELGESVFQKDHPSLLGPLLELGKIYHFQKDYTSGKAVLERALKLMDLTPEKDSLDRLGVLHSLSGVYCELGQFSKSLILLDECLAILQQKVEDDHPSFGGLYNAFSLVYEDMEDFPRALEYQQKCLANFELNYKPGHPNIAIGYNNISVIQAALEDYDSAIQSGEFALSIFQEKLPPEHRNNVRTKIRLSGFYYKRAFSKLESSLAEALQDFETAFDYHPEQPKFLLCMAMCEERLGQSQQVEASLLRAATLPSIACSYFDKPCFISLDSHPQFIALRGQCNSSTSK